MSDIRKGIFFMLLSAIGLSFFSLFVKLGTESVPFLFLTFLRFLVPLILISPYFIWKVGMPHFSHLGHFHLQLGRVSCLLIYQYAIFYYLTRTSLLNATVLQNIGPMLIPILEMIFMGHRLKKGLLVGMLISFIGVLFILGPLDEKFGWITLVGVIAILGQAGSQVFFGLQSRAERRETNLFYLFFLSSIISLLVFLFIAPFEQGIGAQIHALKNVDQQFYWYLLGLSLATICNQAFRGEAYRYARPGVLAPIFYFSVLVSAFLDWIVLREWPGRWTILGAICVVVGGLLPFLQKQIKEHH